MCCVWQRSTVRGWWCIPTYSSREGSPTCHIRGSWLGAVLTLLCWPFFFPCRRCSSITGVCCMGGKPSRGTASCAAATWQEMMCSTPLACWGCKLSLVICCAEADRAPCWCVTTTTLHIPQTPPPSLSSSLSARVGEGAGGSQRLWELYGTVFCLSLSLVSSRCLCTQPGLLSRPLCLGSSELGLITLWEVLLQSSAFRIWNLFLPVWSFMSVTTFVYLA